MMMDEYKCVFTWVEMQDLKPKIKCLTKITLISRINEHVVLFKVYIYRGLSSRVSEAVDRNLPAFNQPLCPSPELGSFKLVECVFYLIA
jgi:hypothetical protein